MLSRRWYEFVSAFSTNSDYTRKTKVSILFIKKRPIESKKGKTRFFSIWLTNYTERKKKRRVNFIPKFHSSLKKFVKYFTMITKRYMYGTNVLNFIGLWSTSLELLKFIGSYPPNLEIKIKLKINIGCAPSCCRCCPNSPLDRVNQSIDSSHRDVIPFIDQRIP